MHKILPRDNRHQHNHFTDAAGRVWVTRSVSRAKCIPGYKDIDPLTVPFFERESVWRKWKRIHGLASDERGHLRYSVKTAR